MLGVKQLIFATKLKVRQEISEKSALDGLADEHGVAVALVDGSSREVYVSNNNSICRNLNPDGDFTTHCRAFCGTAFEEASEVGSTVSFTCHAGLECRAVPVVDRGQPLVAIIGRTFVTAENYRRATTRAISGDWKNHSPTDFFENILLASSVEVLDVAVADAEKLLPSIPTLNKTANDAVKPLQEKSWEPLREAAEHSAPKKKSSPVLSNIVAKFNREVGLGSEPAKPTQGKGPTKEFREFELKIAPKASEKASETAIEKPEPEAKIAEELGPKTNEKRAAEARAWRSFFGSLLKMDYAMATESILEFVALQYGLSAMIWLEKNDKRLVNTAAYGEMKNRKLRLGIASDDKRLLDAANSETPLEIIERPKQRPTSTPRTMYLFPIGMAGEISAGIAILEKIEDEKTKRQIARICLSIAPQLEILRLRTEVARGETLSTAVRRFSQSLKLIDTDDLWLKLTQNTAEMLGAERASLMIFNEKTKNLDIKALIGGFGQTGKEEIVGERVARLVFDKNKPIIVPDVAQTGLPPAAANRQYKTPSFMSCPLAIGGRSIGVMSFADKATGKPFDRGSLNLLQAIAPQIAVAIDRAALKKKAGEFEQLSVTDALTGLLNRRYIEARLTEEVKRSNRHGFPMSFMMIDVDHFKSYNDEFGHPAGDQALKIVGQVIRETLRGADVAARYGGEEFSILLPQTTREEAGMIGERIRINIAETAFPYRRVTTSVGIASCAADLCSVVDIVQAADLALYEAKRRGRNRVMAFEQIRD